MIQDTVIKEISNHLRCDAGQISPDMRLDELGIDSLGAITILYELEDQLDVEVPNNVFDSLNVVNDIVVQLEQLVNNKVSG
ncbi:MAG: acyl carrier protein [Pseudomonadota bacterium]